MASVILLVLLTGVAGVLTSSIAAHTVARERTAAEQCASDTMELIRRLPDYKNDVGTNPGNPAGKVAPAPSCGNGHGMTAHVDIRLVDDPTPTSYSGSNYKRVTVYVSRDRDSKELARMVTLLSPDGRPTCPSCGATLSVNVIDLGNNQPMVGVNVNLSNGPSANRVDVTDSSGFVSFGALDPNPTSGAQAYYDLNVTGLPTGYQTIAADVPPGTPTPPTSAGHVQLAPSQQLPVAIGVYKPATINVVLQNGAGAPFTGGAKLKILSSFTNATTTVTVAAGVSSQSIISLAGQPIIPGATYTIHGYTTGALCADASSKVPASGYPGNTTETFTLAFTSCPMGGLAVNAQQLGTNAPCVPVTLADGPNDIALTGTTDSAGNVSFSNIPSGSGYTITTGSPSRFGQAGSTTASVTTGATTAKTLTLADPPTTTVTVNVSAASQPVGSGVPVTLSGGSCGIVSQTVNTVSGVATFNNVPTGTGFPSGTGYTAAVVSYNGQSGSVAIPTITSNYSANLPMPTGTINVTVLWAALAAGVNPVTGTATITGGPFGGTYPAPTIASGLAAVTVPSTTASFPYVVKASKNGSTLVTGTSVTSLAAGATATSTVNLTPVKTLTLTIFNGTVAGAVLYKSKAVSVSITGGPNGTTGNPTVYTWSGTTNGTTGATAPITVPSGTGTYRVIVKLNPCSGAANSSNTSTGTSVSAAATPTTANIPLTSTTCPAGP